MFLVVALSGMASVTATQENQGRPSSAKPLSIGLTAGEVIERITANEKSLIQKLADYQPMVEVYLQDYVPDSRLGLVPKDDTYFLTKLDLNGGFKTNSLLPPTGGLMKSILGAFKVPFSMKYMPNGFAAMMLVDGAGFDSAHYTFDYLGGEMLGEVRCMVFDVKPQGNRNNRFVGRIWVEDRGYNIVRFNGINTGSPSGLTHQYFFHVDSWRMNMGPGEWLPTYVYAEETNLRYGILGLRKLHFKGQVRIWGYHLKRAGRQRVFTDIVVEDPYVQDKSGQGQQISLVGRRRSWELQAEDNILERLEKAGLLAPEGDVDKVLQTVVDNLAITNKLDLQPVVRCRVLMTSPFESFTVGHTIVLSRGLIDVLPDEASLSMILAHELGHIILGHQLIDTKYSFSDRMLIDDAQILDNFRFGSDPAGNAAADVKAMELLKNSPYADKLANAGLFIRALQGLARQLPNLVRSYLGDSLANNGGEILRYAGLTTFAPKLEAEQMDQIAALPLGGRIEIDPWSDRLKMIKTQPVALNSAWEKMPFEVTPLIPYLTYQAGANGGQTGTPQTVNK
jgi:hypothetical protein